MLFGRRDPEMPTAETALRGRETQMQVPPAHEVLGTSMVPPFPENTEVAYFAMGCFWGAERIFWELEGAYTTAVGYQGGITPNPTYSEVCTGQTGHTEAVLVVFRPQEVSYEVLLKHFWEQHDPTQGMRQGNDAGTQYRSAIYTTTEAQAAAAASSKVTYGAALDEAGRAAITTEIAPAGPFYYAEPEHQQYLAKNPGGYCNHGFNGVSCQLPV
jgi:peptide-methionine (S)-S-oxide reductase